MSGAAPADDVRVNLWIDSKLWVNQWQEGYATTRSVQQTVAVLLEEDHWYPLRLDVRTTAAALHVRLMWSSRSQRDEVIPTECLYSVLDEHAEMSATEDVAFKIGSVVVGEAGPLAPSSFGEPLFSDYAHVFTVLAPAGCACDADRRAKLREVIDAEKPAHTDYHLCFIRPRMRVGFQARLGIDAIVANAPAPMRLNEQALGRGSYLADLPGKAGRVGDRATVGQNLIVG